jgi:hypothetical protein
MTTVVSRASGALSGGTDLVEIWRARRSPVQLLLATASAFNGTIGRDRARSRERVWDTLQW